MSELPTEDELRAWAALAEGATPTPWANDGRSGINHEPGREPWSVTVVGNETRGSGFTAYDEFVMSRADGDFIAAARDAVPRLLALVRAQAATITERDARLASGVAVIAAARAWATLETAEGDCNDDVPLRRSLDDALLAAIEALDAGEPARATEVIPTPTSEVLRGR